MNIKQYLSQYPNKKKLFYAFLIILALSISTAAFAYQKNQVPKYQSDAGKNSAGVGNESTGEASNAGDQLAGDTADAEKIESKEAGSKSGRTADNFASPSSNSSDNSQSSQESSQENTPPLDPDSDESSPPPESPSAIVAFYADNQSDTDSEDQNHQRVVNYILGTSANPVFHAGDLMEDGTQNSLDRFNAVTTPLRATRTFYAALGNNDRKIGDAATPSPLFLGNFEFPGNEKWYSINTGNLHMVILDSAFSAGSAEQLNWLRSDLQSAASQSKITGVMFHHPTFASSITQILIDDGVDFVVSGHNHSYAHISDQGIHYFVTSGQPSLGYFLARVYSSKVEIFVYNNSNSLIDSVSFNER